MTDTRKAGIIITILSIVVPALVAILLFTPFKLETDYEWIRSLPKVNAILNGTTAILLILGGWFAKTGNISLHKLMMSLSLLLGTLFLLSYVTYHGSVQSVRFGDVNGDYVVDDLEQAAIGSLRIVYLIILLSHIALSIVVVPFVLRAFYFALAGDFKKHVKTVKYTWPIWLYVSVTGVMVYVLASPYYQ
ncbi:DUF420 domain-containing protein [Reichenbachiella versicolor]|uniref:DUF420 domain-containing protein n=1 Tax=Reichenbachiella versicolor TaxID=1821036 RepID=UPI000D6DD6A2|nr:DUF420 domain-containing protein [Reichenbachiella versicolor]